MKNYLIANIRLHQKFWLQIACKYSQIHANSQAICTQKYFFFLFLPNFFGKMTSLQPVKCSISNFWYYLTQPILYGIYNNFNPLLDRIMGNKFPRLSLCLNLQVQISLLRTCNCLQIDVET